MKRIVGGSEMKALDGCTITGMGVPSCVLMERAAECVARKAEQLCDQKKLQILAICGTFNQKKWRPLVMVAMILKCYNLSVMVMP